jgi:hypothetical protein
MTLRSARKYTSSIVLSRRPRGQDHRAADLTRIRPPLQGSLNLMQLPTLSSQSSEVPLVDRSPTTRTRGHGRFAKQHRQQSWKQGGDVSRETSSNDPAWATWHSPLAHAEGRQRVGTTRLCRGDCSSDSRVSSLRKGSTFNLLNPRTHVARGVRGEGIAHPLGLRIHHKK